MSKNAKSEEEKKSNLCIFTERVKELEALRRSIEKTDPNVAICAGYEHGYPERDAVQVVGCIEYLSCIFDTPIKVVCKGDAIYCIVVFDGVEYFEIKSQIKGGELRR